MGMSIRNYLLEKILEQLQVNSGLSSEYAQMVITQKDSNDETTNTISVVAHPSGNDTLNPPVSLPTGSTSGGGYYLLTGWEQDGEISGFAFADDSLQAENGGLFIVPVGWGGFRHSANNSTTAFVLGIDNGTNINFSPRPTSDKHPNLNEMTNVSGGGQVRLSPGDKLSVWVASDTSGTITLGNANLNIHKMAL